MPGGADTGEAGADDQDVEMLDVGAARGVGANVGIHGGLDGPTGEPAQLAFRRRANT